MATFDSDNCYRMSARPCAVRGQLVGRLSARVCVVGGRLARLNSALGLAAVVEAGGAAIHEHSPVIALERSSRFRRLGTPEREIAAGQVVLESGG